MNELPTITPPDTSKDSRKRPKRLTCACCGASAIGRQWWNRDTGFGLCAPCAAWMESRGESPDEMQRGYGVRGVHYALGIEWQVAYFGNRFVIERYVDGNAEWLGGWDGSKPSVIYDTLAAARDAADAANA